MGEPKGKLVTPVADNPDDELRSLEVDASDNLKVAVESQADTSRQMYGYCPETTAWHYIRVNNVGEIVIDPIDTDKIEDGAVTPTKLSWTPVPQYLIAYWDPADGAIPTGWSLYEAGEYADETVAMTAADAPSPNVLTWSTNLTVYYGWYTFDHSAYFWTTDTGNPTGWVKFDFGVIADFYLARYTIQIPDYADEIDRAPRDWTLQGSVNDTDWDILDTQTDIVFANSEKKTFDVAGIATKYRYYKLDVTDNNGDASKLHIQEIELMSEGVKKIQKD